MGDMGDVFRALSEYNKCKRTSNTEKSTKILMQNNIKYVSNNNGVHLIVTGKNGLYDYWPSTGLFIDRQTKKRRRGVFNLLKEVVK